MRWRRAACSGPGSTTWASPPPRTDRPPAATASATTPSRVNSTTARTTGRRTGSDRAAGAARRDQRPDRLGGAAVAHRARSTSPAETAAYLAAKANLLERITASREQDGWARRDIDTARQAAAAARQAAITAPQEQS